MTRNTVGCRSPLLTLNVSHVTTDAMLSRNTAKAQSTARGGNDSKFQFVRNPFPSFIAWKKSANAKIAATFHTMFARYQRRERPARICCFYPEGIHRRAERNCGRTDLLFQFHAPAGVCQ